MTIMFGITKLNYEFKDCCDGQDVLFSCCPIGSGKYFVFKISPRVFSYYFILDIICDCHRSQINSNSHFRI